MLLNLFLSDKAMKYFYRLIIFSCFVFTAGSCKKDQVSAACESNKTISYSSQIKPMIENNCLSCHSTGGNSPSLTDHASVATHATHVLNSLTGNGAQLMPLGGPALNDSLISQFSCWIAQGKKNN
jgi:hypothetical protein